MTGLVKTLIEASERAACVARACVGAEDVILVAEKSEGEANARFEKDFKTIADVLAQEAAKLTIISNYPEMAGHVRGEECSEIDGHNIKILDTEEKTAELLSSLVSPKLAKGMAKAAHCNIQHILSSYIPADLPNIDAADIGVWIDPIDATAEFIAGVRNEAKAGSGLDCVTVLIGAYLRSTGEPVIGVINQPFYKNGTGRIIWGISYKDTQKWGGTHIEMTRYSNIILMSNAEDAQLKQKFLNSMYNIETHPGAGHKLMKVGLGEAEAYVLSKGTTFLWDTCAPHAILKAKGGDIISFSSHEPIKYNIPESKDTQGYCNHGGIIAYDSDDDVFHEILTLTK